MPTDKQKPVEPAPPPGRPSLAVIFHRFGPYHRTRIQALATQFDVVGVELSKQTDQYAWDAISLNDRCRHITVCNDCDSRTLHQAELYRRISDALGPLKLDAVAINGWSDNGALASLRWCKDNDVPAIAMSESNATDFERSRSRERVKRCLVANFSSALVGGSLSYKYINYLGMPHEGISQGYDIVDNAHFTPPGEAGKANWRNTVGVSRPYFLASNRFIEKKNLPRLLEAFADYRERHCLQIKTSVTAEPELGQNPTPEPFDLVLLGDGPQKRLLVELGKDLGIANSVHYPGFKQYNELPHYYWGASVFIHASTTEQWGLVINEAMAAGLPVIASDRCGSVADLVENGKNGIVFSPQDTKAMADAMLSLATDDELREDMGNQSAARITAWGPDRFASGMQEAVNNAIRRPINASWIDRMVLEGICRLKY